MSILDDYTLDTSAKYEVYYGSMQHSVTGGRLVVSNNNTQGVLLTPYKVTRGLGISVEITLIQDSAGLQHAGIWVFDESKTNWLRFYFQDNTVGTTSLRGSTPKLPSFIDIQTDNLTVPFSSKNTFKLEAIHSNSFVFLYLDGVFIRSLSWPFQGFGFAFFVYGATVAYDNLSLILPFTVDDINITSTVSTAISSLNIYSDDESGSFSGIVTQGESGQPKTPLKAEVLLYDRMTNRLLQRTWSSDAGVYSFNGLDTGREYYAVTLHPNRTYNAAIQDGLKSGMTT